MNFLLSIKFLRCSAHSCLFSCPFSPVTCRWTVWVGFWSDLLAAWWLAEKLTQANIYVFNFIDTDKSVDFLSCSSYLSVVKRVATAIVMLVSLGDVVIHLWLLSIGWQRSGFSLWPFYFPVEVDHRFWLVAYFVQTEVVLLVFDIKVLRCFLTNWCRVGYVHKRYKSGLAARFWLFRFGRVKTFVEKDRLLIFVWLHLRYTVLVVVIMKISSWLKVGLVYFAQQLLSLRVFTFLLFRLQTKHSFDFRFYSFFFRAANLTYGTCTECGQFVHRFYSFLMPLSIKTTSMTRLVTTRQNFDFLWIYV